MEIYQKTGSNARHDLKTPSNNFASSILQSVFGGEPAAAKSQILSSDTQKADEPKTPDTLIDTTKVLARLESRKEKASVALGIGANEVETLPFDLSALESEGIFLNIDCRGFGSLVGQLEWKTLGIKLPEHAAVRVSPPRAGLLPDIYRNKLMRGQAQAHHALNKYGFRFTLCETVWGTNEYKWIPWNAFEQFEQEYKRACATLSTAKAEVLEKYDEIVATLIDSFRELADDSANRFQATMTEPFDRMEFIEAVVANAIGMIPTREMIRDGLARKLHE